MAGFQWCRSVCALTQHLDCRTHCQPMIWWQPHGCDNVRAHKPQPQPRLAAIKCRKPWKVARQGELNAKETGLSKLEAMKCYAALLAACATKHLRPVIITLWQQHTTITMTISLWQRHTPMVARYPIHSSEIPHSHDNNPMAERYPYGSDIPYSRHDHPVAGI